MLLKQIRQWFYHTKLHSYLKYKAYLNDETYISWQYRKRLGKELSLSAPTTFNEKNNWRKLFDRRDEYTDMVDKFKVKQIICERVGKEHTFELLGSWKQGQDIDFDALPDQFVLKTNHAGGVIVCRDKAGFDRKKAIDELNNNLKLDYYLPNREWPYKNVQRRIIAEAYMGENLTDYKVYCFNGVPKYVFVWENQSRADGRKPQPYFVGAYDFDWKKSEIELEYPSLNVDIPSPEGLEELLEVSTAMSKGIPFVRVDCYIIGGRVYVGEMTFFPWSAYMRFKDEKWDRLLGDLEELPVLER